MPGRSDHKKNFAFPAFFAWEISHNVYNQIIERAEISHLLTANYGKGNKQMFKCEAANNLWKQGKICEAAKLYVEAYFAQSGTDVIIEPEVEQEPEGIPDSVAVYVQMANWDRPFDFVIWFEPTINAVYGEY